MTATGRKAATREAPEEVPVALVYDGTTHAVLMATPADLEDLARGFSLTEGIITDLSAIRDIEIVEQPLGIEARIWLCSDAARAHLERRRAIVGPTGCGLCGVESLEQALPQIAPIRSHKLWRNTEIAEAVARLRQNQPLGTTTRAVHAAGLWRDGGFLAVREDVGRHNALDKLAGATAGEDASGALVVLTSRVSVEMVQKAARMGASGIAAISAPTALAVRIAIETGLLLVAVARDDGHEAFAHAERLL